MAASRISASSGSQVLGGGRVVDLDLVDEQEAEQSDGVGEHDHPLLGQRGDGLQDPPLLRRRRVADQPGAGQERHDALDELLHRQRAQVRRVDRLGLLEVEPGGVGADPGDVEGLDHLGHREDVAVLGDRPAEQRQVVGQALGQEAALAVDVEVGLRVPLGQLLVALAGDVGQVAEPRGPGGDADVGQRPVEGELTRGGGQQVLAAQDVGDAHEGVVHRVHERVERHAVGPHQHEVRHGPGGEADLAPHEVVPHQVLVGHRQPQHRLAALGPEGGLLLLGQEPVVVVVAELGVLPRGEPAGVDLLVRREGLVGMPRGQQLGGHVAVDVVALRLPVGLVRAAHLRALVPVQAEPAHAVEQVPVGLLGVPGRVGVLDAEHELPAGVPRVRPVEQRRPHQADVHHARRRRAEPGADGARDAHRFPPAVETASAAVTVLLSVPSPSIVTSTRWPGLIGPTPDGVPVRTTSPGSRVMTWEM